MNCPCSGVYVCAYIVIFLPKPAKKSGLVYSSFSLSPLWFPSLLKGKSTVNISYTQQIQTSRQTTLCIIFISVQFTFIFRTCKLKHLNNLTSTRSFWKTKDKLATEQSFQWEISVYLKITYVRTKGILRKYGKSELKLTWSPLSLFARLWLKCIWAAVA